MKRLVETLRSFGIEVPEDRVKEVRKKLSENYKNIGEVEKIRKNLETDRDVWKQRAGIAEETLKKFEGIDLAAMQAELAAWKQKAEGAEAEYAERLAQRDFEAALKEETGGCRFTSQAAKRAIMAEIREAGLKVKDGKILGLSELLTRMKEKDPSAFVDEGQERLKAGRAKPYTEPLNRNGGARSMTGNLSGFL